MHESSNVFIAGPRQSGKTSLLLLLGQRLLESGVPDEQIVFSDLEQPRMLGMFESGLESILHHLLAEGVDLSKRAHLMLDEVHLLNNPSQILKLLADHHPGIKVWFTGSSTIQARRKFTDAMTGRHVTLTLLPLSMDEVLTFRGFDSLRRWRQEFTLWPLIQGSNLPSPPDAFHLAHVGDLVNELLSWGCYPAVIQSPSATKKRAMLDGLSDTYVRRDLRDIFAVDNAPGMFRFLSAIAARSGTLLNVHSLASDLGMARATIMRYLDCLEHTFIARRCPPFFSNRLKQITKTPKIYMVDTGLRNRMLDDHRQITDRPDAGELVETFVYSQLLKTMPGGSLYIFRNKTGTEVDFVWQHEGRVVPIEVKWQAFSQPKVPRSLLSFIRTMESRIAVVVTRDFWGETAVNGCRVVFVPVGLI